MNKTGPKPKPFECRQDLFWYLVGLVATDGCLSSDGRHVNITAKDKRHLEQIKSSANLNCNVSAKQSGFGSIGYQLQIGSKDFYTKLLKIGLTPKKTCTIGLIRVPDDMFQEFFRGVIDGDGNIQRWTHSTNGQEQWSIRVGGVSKPFLSWIGETAERLWGVRGCLHIEQPKTRNRRVKYILKYGKFAAKTIATHCYYTGAFALERKRKLAELCLASHVGWSSSKTAGDPNALRGWKYRHSYGSRTVSKVMDIGLIHKEYPEGVLRCG